MHDPAYVTWTNPFSSTKKDQNYQKKSKSLGKKLNSVKNFSGLFWSREVLGWDEHVLTKFSYPKVYNYTDAERQSSKSMQKFCFSIRNEYT